MRPSGMQSKRNSDGSRSLYYNGRLVGHYDSVGYARATGRRWRGVSVHGKLVYSHTHRGVEAALMELYA